MEVKLRIFGSPWNSKDDKGQKGIALIIVLFVIATLTILVLEFVHSTRINLYIAGNISDGMKAFYLARSGVTVAAGALLDDVQDNSQDHMNEDWAQALPAIPGGEGWVTVEIMDESSKFNINRLVRKSGLPDSIKQEVLKKLFTNLELDPELTTPIIDWIDADSDSLAGGGPEDNFYGYSAGTNSYPSRNGYFVSMNEIMLVNGIKEEIFNKIAPYITIYGDSKLNMNTVDEKVLTAYIQVLSGDDNSSLASEIIAWRDENEENYFKDKSFKKQLVGDVGVDAALAKKLAKHFAASSRYFSVKSEAVVAESNKRCLGIIQRTKKAVKIIYFRPI